MTNRAHILRFSNFVANWRYESYGQIQNFSSISLKIVPTRPKNTGTWIVNTTIALSNINLCFYIWPSTDKYTRNYKLNK